jgi:hypothetical protein
VSANADGCNLSRNNKLVIHRFTNTDIKSLLKDQSKNHEESQNNAMSPIDCDARFTNTDIKSLLGDPGMPCVMDYKHMSENEQMTQETLQYEATAEAAPLRLPSVEQACLCK